jgi:hypothetical protein
MQAFASIRPQEGAMRVLVMPGLVGSPASIAEMICTRPGRSLPIQIAALHLLSGKQDEKTYCLTQRAPVASLILRPSRSFFSNLQN